VAEKNRTKGASPTAVFVARAAEGGEAVTVLLCAVAIVFIFHTIFYQFIILSYLIFFQ
jgi:hypothetical protein